MLFFFPKTFLTKVFSQALELTREVEPLLHVVMQK